MNKKIMLLALASVSATMFALPAAAPANSLHINETGAFTVSGGAGDLRSTNGLRITCTSVSGGGEFTTTTTGKVNLTFHGCKDGTFGIHCQSPGQPTGTITAVNLEFHLVTIDTVASAGILITPPASPEVTPGKRSFSAFPCFGVETKLFGNGIVGTISHPACNGSSTTAGLVFKHSVTNGHQQHAKVTAVSYTLESSIGNEHKPTSMESSATITFSNGKARTLTCT